MSPPPKEERRHDAKHWHLSRAVQLPVVIGLVLNIIGGTWWAATLQANQSSNYKEMITRTDDVITLGTVKAQFDNRDIAISYNSKAIERIHDKLDRILEKLNATSKNR